MKRKDLDRERRNKLSKTIKESPEIDTKFDTIRNYECGFKWIEWICIAARLNALSESQVTALVAAFVCRCGSSKDLRIIGSAKPRQLMREANL